MTPCDWVWYVRPTSIEPEALDFSLVCLAGGKADPGRALGECPTWNRESVYGGTQAAVDPLPWWHGRICQRIGEGDGLYLPRTREPFAAAGHQTAMPLQRHGFARGDVGRTYNGSGTGMNRIIIAMVLVVGAIWPLDRAFAQTPPKPATAAAATNRAELSYALGYQAGLDLGQRKLDVDIATVLRGVRDGYSRKKPEYSPQQMQQVIQTMERQMLAQARAAFEKLAAANLQKARTFFAKNGKKQGIVTLPSGVQYKVLASGKGGKSPSINSEVTLQYRGEFLDGTVFNDTEDNGKPVVFPVDRMIPGWRDVITRMHVGDHWQVFVPPDQAYGIRGQLPRIGPNEALVFDIHLLGVEP